MMKKIGMALIILIGVIGLTACNGTQKEGLAEEEKSSIVTSEIVEVEETTAKKEEDKEKTTKKETTTSAAQTKEAKKLAKMVNSKDPADWEYVARSEYATEEQLKQVSQKLIQTDYLVLMDKIVANNATTDEVLALFAKTGDYGYIDTILEDKSGKMGQKTIVEILKHCSEKPHYARFAFEVVKRREVTDEMLEILAKSDHFNMIEIAIASPNAGNRTFLAAANSCKRNSMLTTAKCLALRSNNDSKVIEIIEELLTA